MDRLWAPWRLSYAADPKPPKPAGPDCFVCRALLADPSADRDHHLVARAGRTAVFLNRFPYNNGHLLVVPTAHKADLADLTAEESADLQQWLSRLTAILRRRMNADGFNVGLNLGAAAGAGLPGHLHWHVVPRWNGDNNFMPVVSDTKVIVQSLESLYDLLTGELA